MERKQNPVRAALTKRYKTTTLKMRDKRERRMKDARRVKEAFQ